MALVRINKNPSLRDLRLFSGLWFPLFFAFVGYQAWRKTGDFSAATHVWIPAGVVALICLAVPKIARLVFIGLSYVTFPIGFVLSHVILAFIYFFVLTPIGLLLRVIGKDAMTRSIDRNAKTYWIERKEPRPASAYFRQF